MALDQPGAEPLVSGRVAGEQPERRVLQHGVGVRRARFHDPAHNPRAPAPIPCAGPASDRGRPRSGIVRAEPDQLGEELRPLRRVEAGLADAGEVPQRVVRAVEGPGDFGGGRGPVASPHLVADEIQEPRPTIAVQGVQGPLAERLQPPGLRGRGAGQEHRRLAMEEPGFEPVGPGGEQEAQGHLGDRPDPLGERPCRPPPALAAPRPTCRGGGTPWPGEQWLMTALFHRGVASSDFRKSSTAFSS